MSTSGTQRFEHFAAELRSEAFRTFLQSRIDYDLGAIERQFINYVEEAEFGARLLSEYLAPGRRVLEIGSGSGILTAWLLRNGHDVTGIEPSALGFGFNQDIVSALWAWFDLPANRLHDLRAEQLDPAQLGKFDLIFSINVIEHIPLETLEPALARMQSVLAEGGFMVHHCPNYLIPYEPHYGLPLMPLFPQVTGRMKGVAGEELWQSLNFITLPQVRRIAGRLGLDAAFQKKVMQSAFSRLLTDEEYAGRHPLLTLAAKAMRATGVLFLLGLIPPILCTPMTVRLSARGG